MKARLDAGTRVRVKDTPELRRIRKMPCGRYGTVLSYHDWLFGGPVDLYKVQIDRGEKWLLSPNDLATVQARRKQTTT